MCLPVLLPQEPHDLYGVLRRSLLKSNIYMREIHRVIGMLLAMIILFAAAPVRAQDPLFIQRLNGPIVLDGMSDEPAWNEVSPLPMVQYQPVFNGENTERTEVRIAYDDNYLYLSGRLYDSDPDGMRANSLYRDRYSGDDVFAIVLDTFDDNESGLWFSTTPAGIRVDRSVSNDAEFGGGGFFGGVINSSWNTYWDTEVVTNEDGWFVEMRIPFSSLGFQDIDGRVEMGFIVYRYIARKSERHIYPAIPPNWGMGFAKPSEAQTIVLEGVKSSKPLYITPYVIGGTGRDAELNDAGTAYERIGNTSRDIGLDFKYAITNNLTLDATINTDFAQVEADDQQVNLTRFSLFFPEKRQFFQERAGIFDFATGMTDRVFHSRNIGLSEEGPVRILGGGRLVGRLGGWDVGLIDMQTESSGDQPAENFGVLRVKRRVLNTQSYAGVLITSRLGDDGSYNVAYGLDAVLKLSGREYLTAKWVQTFEDEPLESESFDFAEAGFARIQLQRRGDTGISFNTALTYSGRDYNPGIGFVRRRDYSSYFGDLAYGWIPGQESSFRTVNASVFFSAFYRNSDGSLESIRATHSWDMNMKSGAEVRATARLEVEDLLEAIEFPGDTEVPEGRYTFATLEANYKFPDGSFIRGRNNSVSIGSFYDGWRAQVNVEPTVSLSRYVELGTTYRFSRLRFSDRDQSVDVHLVGLKAQIGFNKKVSLNSFIQYNTSANRIAANIRFRYNIKEGNDLWIVFNQNVNTDRERETPILPVSESRTVLLKYTHTFIR